MTNKPPTMAERLRAVDTLESSVRELTGEVNSLVHQMKEVVSRGRTSRTLIWLTIISLFFDIGLTVLIFHNQRRNEVRIAVNRELVTKAEQTVCEAGNKFRSDDLKLWTYVLDLPTPPASPQEAQNRAQFKAFLIQHDAPRDCALG